jgi:polyhydroxyalkanoate synthesis repressor PhaR
MPITPRIIKKYANRRLYDTQTSQTITLQDVRDLIGSGETIQVVEAKTGKDITRSVLIQIVADQELMGRPVLSNEFLQGLIRLDSMPVKELSREFLEKVMRHLQSQQQNVEEAWKSTFRGASIEEFARAALEPAKEFQRQIFTLWSDALSPGKRRDPD